MKTTTYRIALLITTALTISGCATSYVNTPTARIALDKQREIFSNQLIAHAYNAKPAIHFPATIGVAPSGSEAQQQLRMLDADGKLDALKSLPQVGGIVNVSSLLKADGGGDDHGERKSGGVWNKSDLILREAAAKLHADAVLLIAIETHATDGEIFSPLTTLSLGLLPNSRYTILSTALAALVDTRTGYVYATIERSAAKSGVAITWGSDGVISRVRERTERAAMEKMIAEFPAAWRGVVQTHRK